MARQDDRPRQILPIPDRDYRGPTPYDAKDPSAKFEPIAPVIPPKGAPNVLVILLDDCGFAASGTFGGPIETPNLDRLAEGGLKYTRFHTTALCSPTRAALLTGRNHHTVGMGGITEMATSLPGYTSVRPNTCGTIAQTLRFNGYSTAQFGKCHEVPVWEVSPMGPFDRWPTSSGFEKFYGFVGGETSQWEPLLFEGTTPIEPPKREGYHLTEDLADHCIDWVREQKALMPEKPFFVYFAPGATHSPHHAPKEWIERYRGQFDHGWDRLREEILTRQKRLGVIPESCELTARHVEIPAWEHMPSELRPLLCRQMEIYAGFMSHTDFHVGRIIDALERQGVLGDTLVYCIIGDNGASAEGGIQGLYNEASFFNEVPESPEFLLSHLDDLGTEASHNHYAVGWAHALDTPYQWTKQVASHFGGTRNGTIVHWPNGIKARGELRHQFHHVIDVAPTILEAAGLPEPLMINGVSQKPIEGISMRYSFDDARAADRHTTQYFEMFGNRGIYHAGWTALTKHVTPWARSSELLVPFDDDSWELYDTNKDWSQAMDLAEELPEKLAELQRLWLIEAVKHNVLPLDDRTVQRLNPALAGRPDLMRGRSSLLLAGTMERLPENTVPNIKNRSFAVTAELEVRGDRLAAGVIISQGGRMGGWSLYCKEGRPRFCYNFLNLERFYVDTSDTLEPGKHQVRAEFKYDGGGLGKGGELTILVDGSEVGRGRIDKTQPFIFAADETMDVGRETGSPVSTDLPRDTRFTGRVNWVDVSIGDEDFNSLIDPDELLRIAMVKQ